MAIGICLVILAICIFLEAWTEEPLLLKEVMGSKSFVFLGMTQAFWLFPLGLPRLLTIKECKWSFYVIANPEVFSAWLS